MTLFTKYLITIFSIISVGLIILGIGFWLHQKTLNKQLKKYLNNQQRGNSNRKSLSFHSFFTILIMVLSLSLLTVNIFFLTYRETNYEIPSFLDSEDKYLPKIIAIDNKIYNTSVFDFTLNNFYGDLITQINHTIGSTVDQKDLEYRLNLSYQNYLVLTINDSERITDIKIPNIEIYYNGYYCGYEFSINQEKIILTKTHFLNTIAKQAKISTYYQDFANKFENHNYQPGNFIYYFTEV